MHLTDARRGIFTSRPGGVRAPLALPWLSYMNFKDVALVGTLVTYNVCRPINGVNVSK